MDERLKRDTIFICKLKLSSLCLMKDGDLDWFVLVPDKEGASDWNDLSLYDQSVLNEEISYLCGLLKAHLSPAPEKINVANLGNIVKQLHVHVLARFANDRAWPGPVWGGPKEKNIFKEERADFWRQIISKSFPFNNSLFLMPATVDRTEDVQDVQLVLKRSPQYFLKVNGKLPSDDEAIKLFTEETPLGERVIMLVKHIHHLQENNSIGVVDVIRGYPTSGHAMLGLLLLNEKYQRQGLGAKSYREIEKTVILNWPEVVVMRIGVVDSNIDVITFWVKIGFRKTGEKKPYPEGHLGREVIILEKNI
ncbi:MAG: HIT domain-containing protein [Oligoflexia bacterium]|nr:HIT domain-containing protein [Oligoflexia bacterium]